ncbi:hypothetical protein [Cellulomonas sp. ATA003]|uniref:hypothetical protein n=1 Tax=Cellulomonas sp. ATA003 TaxID=3073064 RepID=UPI002873B062|nr:hypothetical protein [Cellulomonas sp. ATA003]WNB86231.1 hypothetical protein REH70_02890 [Cellulomonas sp. ATA003]
MTTITLHDDVLDVTFTTREKIAGLVRDQQVPLASVRQIEVVPDGAAAARGIRSPGLGLPRIRLIGTWRSRTGRSLVAVHGRRPALRVTLAGERWSDLLLAVEDTDAVAARLRAAAPDSARP